MVTTPRSQVCEQPLNGKPLLWIIAILLFAFVVIMAVDGFTQSEGTVSALLLVGAILAALGARKK